jgi:hypothetical protein
VIISSIKKKATMEPAFPYKLKNYDEAKADHPAVYKIHLGKTYFIWKGLTVSGSVDQNCRDIFKFSRAPKRGHIFMPMVEYIRKGRILSALVEVIIQTMDPQLLVDTEMKLLTAGSKDEYCLNENFEPHIPKWLQAKLDTIKPASKKPNKAITATKNKRYDNVPAAKAVNSSTPVKAASGKADKLLQAFANLHGK